MNSKTIIAVVAVVIVVVAAVAAFGFGGNDENEGFVGVVYDGNGGETTEGDDTFRLSENTVWGDVFTNGSMVFDGWNTKADGTGTAYEPGDHISFPAHGYVTLYAQWAYGLSISTSAGDCEYLLIDSEGNYVSTIGNSVALPSDGRAGIAVLAPEGTVWTENGDGRFTGTNGNVVYRLVVTLENVDSMESAVNSVAPNMVNIVFTYSGSVTGDVTYSTGTAIPSA